LSRIRPLPFGGPAAGTIQIQLKLDLAGEGGMASFVTLHKLSKEAVPEPSTPLLGAAGLFALALYRRP
jgi:MYXO-CTERM domain-containing protein